MRTKILIKVIDTTSEQTPIKADELKHATIAELMSKQEKLLLRIDETYGLKFRIIISFRQEWNLCETIAENRLLTISFAALNASYSHTSGPAPDPCWSYKITPDV